MNVFQLCVFVCVLVCVSLGDARSVRTSNHGWEVEEELEPERRDSRVPVQEAFTLQRAQTLQSMVPLSWRFPEDPRGPVMTPTPNRFEPQALETDGHMAVRCGERTLQVEVDQDLLGLGLLVRPEEVELGGCSATEVDHFSHVLVFETELHGCGSTLVMTEDAFIYAFTLVYNPKVRDKSGITRRQRIVIGIECHYPRGGFVSRRRYI